MIARLAFCASALAVAQAAVPADKVTNLPGFGAPLTDTYSGYLTISSSAGTKHLFYLFYTAQVESPDANTPLTLWLNGGPGCSSLEGALQEGGPLWTASGGTSLALNNYSINKFAHTLYLEAPACVGFSYADTAAGCHHDDASQAVDNLAALVAFYAAYPEYATNPFWITGESYAGIYIPTLAHNIWSSNEAGTTNIPLKGILVGNGCIGAGNNVGICGSGLYGDYLQIAQFHGHGFISDAAFAAANAACGNWTARSPACTSAARAAANQVGGGIDVYDIYSGTFGSCDYGSRRTAANSRKRRPVDPESVFADIIDASPANGCTNDADLNTYLNTPEVQTALHARPTTWNDCGGNGGFQYSHSQQDERVSIYPDLILKAKIAVVIFNGEADACVPITDNQWWTSSMGYPVKTAWTQWRSTSGAPGGYFTEYAPPGGGNFTFITARAAGHMVSQTQPIFGYDIFYNAIFGLPWSA